MAAYVVTAIAITDPEGFARYRELVHGTIDPFGGRYIARGGDVQSLEGGWQPPRLVLAAFPDVAAARGWWSAPAYAEAKAQRQRSANTAMVAVAGLADPAPAGTRPAPAYLVVELTIRDADGFARYREMVPPTVAAHGGRYLARGGAITPLEGDWEPQRLTVIEFPAAAQARAWWDSPDYAEARALRQRTTETKIIIVDGI